MLFWGPDRLILLGASYREMMLTMLLLIAASAAFQPTTTAPAFHRSGFVLESTAHRLLIESSTLESSAAADELKEGLIALSGTTDRGFKASRGDRQRVKDIIHKMADLNPTPEPASAYYDRDPTSNDGATTVAGKWTLIYTDAPDITALDSGGPFSTAKLGRIGQECSPPTIKNVIEWQRPEWAASLPFSGDDDSRVLQKVVCEGSASPSNPATVDLKILGLELEGNGGESGPAALFKNNPVSLQGPLSAPFGKFDLLFLDETMRITKTFQGYYAVNMRDEEWF